MHFRRIMRATLLVFVATAVLFLHHDKVGHSQNLSADSTTGSKPDYPVAKKGDQVDDYHGVSVPDPYRWLEDLDSPDTRAWVEAENKLTFGYLNTIPARERIKDRLTKLWNYERFSIPSRKGKYYFYSRNNGLQNQSVLYKVADLNSEPAILLDPNSLSKDGTVALSGTSLSEDGKLLAYGLSSSGSDWQEWHVRNVETGADLPDLVKWVKFAGASWKKDGSGFFYSRYDEPKAETMMKGTNYFQKLYFHKIGAPQSDDQLIYDRPDQKDWFIRGSVTQDGNYLVINIGAGSDVKNRVYYKDLRAKDSQIVKLLDDFDASYNLIDNDGPVFWFHTDLGASRGKVIAIDTRHPERSNWKVVIPESQSTLEGVNLLNKNMFVASYLTDAHTQVKIFKTDGAFVRDVSLPGTGSAGGFGGERTDKETFYSYTSFTTPPTIFRYDLETGKSTVFRQAKVDFDPNAYETKQVFYPSKDGTKIPMFITYKKGIKLDGNNPTYLYAYGGFNISTTPAFSVGNLVWMEMGGVYASACLRGGGEYGEEWHQVGTKLRKQNVFDDFIAAAQWLIANKYTSTPKLAVGGASNGGLLIGAVLTQRPELFGAALPAVGVMDMLRFQKFTVGFAWISDYGSSDNAEQFKAIYAYSPLQNLKPGTRYPPTMVTTADHDDRVWPGHSFKFAATMQADQAGAAPILIRIETKAGHGGGKPTSKTIEELADRWAFLVKSLDMTGPS
jgi:prolyl oligopeptidase